MAGCLLDKYTYIFSFIISSDLLLFFKISYHVISVSATLLMDRKTDHTRGRRILKVIKKVLRMTRCLGKYCT